MHMTDTRAESSLSSINDDEIPMDKPLYISFDPGPHTGWAVLTQDRTFFLGGESISPDLVPHSFAGLLQRMSTYYRMESIVIIESFTLTNRPKDTKQATITLQQIGALKYVATRFGITPIMQIANTRKLADTKTLKSAGLWCPRLTHAQSASRHLGSYLITKGILKPV